MVYNSNVIVHLFIFPTILDLWLALVFQWVSKWLLFVQNLQMLSLM